MELTDKVRKLSSHKTKEFYIPTAFCSLFARKTYLDFFLTSLVSFVCNKSVSHWVAFVDACSKQRSEPPFIMNFFVYSHNPSGFVQLEIVTITLMSFSSFWDSLMLVLFFRSLLLGLSPLRLIYLMETLT